MAAGPSVEGAGGASHAVAEGQGATTAHSARTFTFQLPAYAEVSYALVTQPSPPEIGMLVRIATGPPSGLMTAPPPTTFVPAGTEFMPSA